MTLLIFKSKALEVNWRLGVYGQMAVDWWYFSVGRAGGDQYVLMDGELHCLIPVDLFFGVSFSKKNGQRPFLSRVCPSVYWSSGIQGGGMKLELLQSNILTFQASAQHCVLYESTHLEHLSFSFFRD